MSLLHEVLVKAIRNKRTDKGRVDAILKVLGLEKDDVIVDREDLGRVLAYAADAENTLEVRGYSAPDGYDDEDVERADASWYRLHAIGGYPE